MLLLMFQFLLNILGKIINFFTMNSFIILTLLFTSSVTCRKLPNFSKFFVPNESGLENRIVGGQVTSISLLPYQISFQILHQSKYYHICGGSIVTTQHILTAAHCVYE